MKIPKPWKRKSSGIWYVQWDGKQINLGRDKKLADQKYNEMLRSNKIGPAAPRTRRGQVTFHELIDAFAAWVQEHLASYDVKKYLFNGLKLFTPDQLAAIEFKPWQLEEYIRKQPRIKSPTTKNKVISDVSGMFNWGIRFKLVDENPIDGMPRPTPRVRQDFLPPERFAELFNNTSHDSFRDFLMVMLESGARAQEMFKLEAKHFDGSKFTFIIEDSKGRTRSRVIFLPERARLIVERLVAEHPEGLIFRNSRGTPWNKDSINCHMRRLKEKLGMPGLCATTLRHSYAHWRLTSGQDAMTVAKLLGHVDTKMLARRYGHLEGSAFLEAEANRLVMKLPESPDPASNDAA